MIKLLVVDDEPLVQVGIQSMINWSDLGIEICATAMNGYQALKLIDKFRPELVITDIKMPIMNGLELIKKCNEEQCFLPQFIVLTSYEEFPLIKEAMKYQVIDYLIKLELNASTLTETVNKALKRISGNQFSDEIPTLSTNFFYEKFMIRILNNLFEDEGQFYKQANELKLTFDFPAYVLCLCTIIGNDNNQIPQDKLLNLYLSVKQMVENLAPKYMPCYTASLDSNHFCMIFCLENEEEAYRNKVSNVLEETFKMVNNYFNVSKSSTTTSSGGLILAL